ncbi:hypothetical protein EG359_20600 [Chryseobacterium joostei]|nr:hypothetical protein EG359_20600 [Chryseobacterium joostei]HCM36293.1 hypothetical protein [Chryseobacterium sp.]
MLSVTISFGQTLKVSDLRKAFNYYKPTEHKQLLSKGFKILNDTSSGNQKKINFIKSDTKEIVELIFTEDVEGGEYLSITYYLPSELTYNRFIATLTTYKFKYSKRNKRYQLPTSSYSGENVYPKGLTLNNEKKYYSLEYVSYIDKALSGPRPGLRNDIETPPINDSINRPK